MSLQVLGDVQLVTKQEVEAMLGATVVPESRIQQLINVEKSARELADETISSALQNEVSARELADNTLTDKIEDEARIRDESDKGLRTDLEQEASVRQQADTELVNEIEKFRRYESETYPNAYVDKIEGLPLAIITVTNHDKSLHVGDTIATVDEKFFPKQAVEFVMYVEQIDEVTGNDKTCMLICRLDNAGNINVVNMFDVVGATSATDRTSFVYFTEV